MLRPAPPSNLDALAAIGQQLNDESYLVLPEQRLYRSHDPGLAADLDVIADLEWLPRIQMAGRHDLLAAPKLIAIVDPATDGRDDTRRNLLESPLRVREGSMLVEAIINPFTHRVQTARPKGR